MSTLITSTAQIGTIKDAGGNQTAMTIDSSGRILTPQRPAFHAQLISNVSCSADTVTLMPLKTNGTSAPQNNSYNNLNHAGWDNTNTKFVAPVAGVYLLFARTGFYNNNTPSRFAEIKLSFNGSDAHDDMRFVGSHSDGASYADYDGIHGSRIVQLAVNDEIQMKVRSTTAMTVMAPDTSLGGYLIG